MSLDTKPILIDNDIELELGKTVMESGIKAGAELKLVKTSSSEILTFIYNVYAGLGTTMSSYFSDPKLTSHAQYTLGTAMGHTTMKENIYISEHISNAEVECLDNGKKYNITTNIQYLFESFIPDNMHEAIYENKLSERGGIYVKENVNGTKHSKFSVTDGEKTITYYAIEPIASTYMEFPANSNDETIKAYSNDGKAYQLLNLGDHNVSLVIEF